MHSAFRFALLASSALLLSACATQGSDIGNALAGQSFTWDASSVAQAEQTPSLAFSEDGRVSGVSGCNRVMGSFTVEDGKFTFSKMGTTMMMCSPDSMEVEQVFLENLGKTQGASLTEEGILVLTDASGAELMRLTPAK